ncbi:TOTE conflict system archaeo-eukaryotic primase domain-containing protein [Nonomuraea sp. KM90]|uniref:TOTE conflict system archaeo-eukaryotic primase domain-containing protein n=1 Tax=Nonomuraea sp. KM90 TaxID=3457428 RepID=UPI003FCCF6B8
MFRALFVGRTDVYARRWVSRDGKVGWSPAEAKPWDKDKPDSARVFLPFTDDVIDRHLRRPASARDELHVGLYPLLPDDTTRVLVCDFDGKSGRSGWQDDAQAYVRACAEAGVPALAEVSRSGQGAHVWIFFIAPVAASSARALGMALLRRAMDTQAGMPLSTYDRLIPSQDFVPINSRKGARFGNLIALPLNGAAHATGATLFCDPATWIPYPDQFAYLSQTRRLTPQRVKEIADDLGTLRAGPSHLASRMPAKPRRGALGTAPETVNAVRGPMLRIATAGLPPSLLAALKHAASFHNSEFYRRQNQRFSTYNCPRLVCCFDDSDPDWLALPRGLFDEAAALIAAAGGTLTAQPARPRPPSIRVTFTGQLTPVQAAAIDAMAAHDCGVLVAPTGAGKTVMACALIARHRLPTAVVVNRAELLDQWRDRLAGFLDLGGISVGSLAAGKDQRGGIVDLIMLQTLSHRDASPGLLDRYGLVVVDECHAVGAPAAEAALRQVPAERWIGLSATPYRADGMNPIITMQCGPIRHEITDQPTFPRRLIVHPTPFTTHEPGTDGASMQAIYGELAADQTRNRQLVADIADAYERGRSSLVLTNRVEHIAHLADALTALGVAPRLLHGRLPRRERDRVRQEISAATSGPLVVVAIDKVAGEGLDVPVLDTLFLATPIAFKGRVIQQVGRIMRDTEARKRDAEVHDYLDSTVPVLERMHHKRRRVLAQLGFTITARSGDAPTRDHPVNAAAAVSPDPPAGPAPAVTTVTAAQVRSWARSRGIAVPARGRLSATLWQEFHASNP